MQPITPTIQTRPFQTPSVPPLSTFRRSRIPLPQSLLLFLPVTPLLIIPTNPQRIPKPIILFNLRLRQLMHLMHFQALLTRSAYALRCFFGEFLAEGLCLSLDFFFVDSIFLVNNYSYFLKENWGRKRGGEKWWG